MKVFQAPQNMGFFPPKIEGTVGSHGTYTKWDDPPSIWAIYYYKSLAWPFWGSDSLTITNIWGFPNRREMVAINGLEA